MTRVPLFVSKRVLRSVVAVLLAFAALSSATTATAKGPAAFYCYVNLPNGIGYIPSQATYFSAVFTAGDVGGGAFSLYVEKKYSAHPLGGAGCSHSWNREAVEASLQTTMAQVKAGGHTVIETGWTYDQHAALMAELAKNPPPPPPAAAPAAPKPAAKPSPAQTAYEKALAAQRPASNTGKPASAGAAAEPAQLDDDADGENYSFCYNIGSTAGSRPNYYVTPIFAWSPAVNAQAGFSKTLHAAHPRENLGGTICSAPQSMTVTQTARTNQENKARTQYNIVEVPWKP